MIESLTKEQEELFPVYRDKWLKIGLATGPANRVKAEDAINRAYKISGLTVPKKIVWSTSPFAGWIVVCILKNDELMKKIYKDYQKLGDSVREAIGASVGEAVREAVGASVGAFVGASVGASVGTSVRGSVWGSVGASVWEAVREAVRSFNYSEAGFGSHDAAWLGFYNYFLEVLKIEACEKLIPLMDLAKEGGWFYPYKNICVISERPEEININGTKIHKNGGPAIRYSDGFSVWALNGVRVSQEIAETSKDKLSCKLIGTEKNAEVRREIVRKIGIERIYRDLGANVIDSWNGYELIALNIGDKVNRPYLKMINQSVGLIHIEGVPPDIKKCKEALAWRNSMDKFEQPIILT